VLLLVFWKWWHRVGINIIAYSIHDEKDEIVQKDTVVGVNEKPS
jgi:hypothetical protein